MYMEPDGAETVHKEDAGPADAAEEPKEVKATEDGDEINSEDKDEKSDKTTQQGDLSDKSLESESQNFFPSFAELFTNHRLPIDEQQQQQHYRPNRFLGYFQRDRNAYQAAASDNSDNNNNDKPHPLLGSGNFGVIRGGTYYPEEKENDEYTVDETLYNPYFQEINSRGRSNYYRNPKPQPVRGGDFFANFRDFADITAPPKSSFSHLSVVYANKNGTRGRITEPRNIIETLRMLEEESEMTTTELPQKKLSNGKRKLLKMKKYQEDKARKSRVTVEPLLALS
ncbi:uncharacterized protein LOC107271427 isoform X2 [Cephus cinctus]|nr:uncharacterized protein LOC107271427 isoform X2 [Cephus cinctus]